MQPDSASELFAHCNHTELYQICRRLHLNVSPAMPREKLIAFITGDDEPPAGWSNTIDSWRYGIMSFLLDHWEQVRSQLDCPARSGDPKACFTCVDAQVVSCLVDNAASEHLIQLKRKNNP